MRRSLRVLFTVCAIASSLWCALCTVLWVRSYSGTDYLERSVLGTFSVYQITHTERGIMWTRGQIRFFTGDAEYYPFDHVDLIQFPPSPVTWSHGRLGPGHAMGWETPVPETFWQRLGFMKWATGFEASFASERRTFTTAPAWLPAGVFAILPAIWLIRRWRTRRRRTAGCCVACGYDLRASTGRCPECGHGAAAA